MADNQNTTAVKSNTFTKGMIKDMIEIFNAEGVWTHARNAVNNTDLGQLGELGNEPANYRMIRLPYTLVGAVHNSDDKWLFFTTDEVESEIGEFDESDNSYRTIVNARCLNFSASHLITGVTRENFDCTTSVYFDDGVNPTRVLNIDRVPYKKKPNTSKNKTCVTPEYTTQLDCEALRLATLVTPPCVSVKKSPSGGSMSNGSYQFAVAYTINTQRVTDYLALSNVQALFSAQNAAGGLEITLSGFDSDFDEFELVMISTIAENVTTRRIGFYSTRQSSILVDKLDETLPVVDITMIAQRTPAFERSDALYELNGYLLRTGVYTKTDINYQPQAAKIKAQWVAAEVPADYYVKGGNLTSYLRDEVYAFFIRWVYNTGEKTASFHIPGREANPRDLRTAAGRDAIENNVKGETAKVWEVKDTAERTSKKRYALDNGPIVIAEGNMAYWESSERYPDDKPEIWGDLCGKQIRHHKFPDNSTAHIHDNSGTNIILLGVKFDGITHPLNSQDKPDKSIIGYEILRGSRQGNKTVIAKGLLNNMGEYDIDPDVSTRKGLYANYPFNDLRIDPFLSKKPVKGGCKGKDYEAMGTFKNNIFSFHSPETQFRDPFLNPYELKIHGELSGVSTNKYSPVFRHPKHKMLTDLALIVSSLAGIASGMLLIKGKTTKTVIPSKSNGVNILFTSPVGGTYTSLNLEQAAQGPAIETYERLDRQYRRNVLPVVNAILKNKRDAAYKAAMGLVDGIPGNAEKSTTQFTEEGGSLDNMPLALAIANEVFLFTYYFSQGTEAALKIMKSVVPYFQHAYQLNAHGFYNTFTSPRDDNRRRSVTRANYINPYLQEFGPEYRINNLFRSRFVAIETQGDIAAPSVRDESRKTIGDLALWSDPTRSFSTPISAHYASLKIKMANQYGQLDGISQVPVSTCVTMTDAVEKVKFTSPVYFGGDVYINRYTEKNAFFFFNDWLFAEQDGSPFNYLSYSNIPYPRYWIDTNDYDITQLPQAVTGGKALPNDLASLDRSAASCRSKVAFRIKDAYFYLFANGVRDFFVESEVNLAYREAGDVINERHYDPYDFTDVPELFRSDVIKSGNYFKYDYSLSVSKLFGNAISWGNVQPRDYNPKIASTCYAYYPNRIIYSLPQNDEQKKDNWKVFLANNYKDLDGDVTTIKGVNQSGAMILFKKDSPVFFNGVDQLQTTGGIKITVGDGGLFAQPLQQISNAEGVYQYGSCQSRFSVINTPAGLFWVSQNQGKVFQYGQGVKEISRTGMKWWFSKYLPSYLLKDFPDFELYDNPVRGVGCMLTYDNTNDILYLAKKDYRLKDAYKGIIAYSHDNVFLRGGLKVYLGDPVYFEDASFTVSYDPKGGENGVWISHHDWHPDFALPSRQHFMTVKNGGLWKHNDRCDLFCNFYGVDYPFEIEFVATTGQEVSILKSVEYQLECYKYNNDCRDLHHILDFNFDRAVIYNTEQVSGQLNLINKPKNDPLSLIDYPIVRQNSIDIIYAKEENKYRFNQFYDITRNRGEFQETDRPIWDTAANGYDRELNTLYTNYQKKDLQHKKFRHYLHRILMKRMVSNDVKMLFRLSNAKVNKSDR
jgi:hypothetical protein